MTTRTVVLSEWPHAYNRTVAMRRVARLDDEGGVNVCVETLVGEYWDRVYVLPAWEFTPAEARALLAALIDTPEMVERVAKAMEQADYAAQPSDADYDSLARAAIAALKEPVK